MGFLDRIKEMGNNLTDEVKKFANKSFLDSATAASALIAAADGTIDADEKKKMMGFMETNESLKVFKMDDIVASFKKWTEKLEFDKELGQAACFEAIAKSRSDAGQARALMRLACAIGAADGDFDADEKAMAQKIAQELGLNASEFID